MAQWMFLIIVSEIELSEEALMTCSVVSSIINSALKKLQNSTAANESTPYADNGLAKSRASDSRRLLIK